MNSSFPLSLIVGDGFGSVQIHSWITISKEQGQKVIGRMANHSNASTTHAWTRATKVKAQVHLEFGRKYMIVLLRLCSGGFTA